MAKDFRKNVKKSGVYVIRNVTNGRIYIGSALVLSRRKSEHFNKLQKNTHSNPFLQADFNKCGKESFIFEVVKITNKSVLIQTEQEYLDIYFDKQNKCYNICPKAKNSSGRKMSEDAKRKISIAQSGSRNQWFGTNGPFFNKNHTEDSKKKISNALYGRKTKKVYQVSKQGKIIRTYDSAAIAARKTKINYNSIRNCLCGINKSAGGFLWTNEGTEK